MLGLAVVRDNRVSFSAVGCGLAEDVGWYEVFGQQLVMQVQICTVPVDQNIQMMSPAD